MRSELIQFNFLDRRSINTGTDRYTSSLCVRPQLPRIFRTVHVEGCRSIVRLFGRLNFHMKDPIDLFYFFVIMEYARGALSLETLHVPEVAAKAANAEPHFK